MYSLQIRSLVQSGGVYDLGGGETPCLDCVHCAGHLDRTDAERGKVSSREGYQCSRYRLLDSGDTARCIDARLEDDACGIQGSGFAPAEPCEIRSMIDTVAHNAHCNDCAHQVPDIFRSGKSIASPWALQICARYVLPLSGEPIDCQSARGDSTICGLEGKGFAPKLVDDLPESTTTDDFWDDGVSVIT